MTQFRTRLTRTPARAPAQLALGISLLLCVPALVAAASPANPISLWEKRPGLSDQYTDFNTHLLQVQTVKSIRFFNQSYTDRFAALKGYASSIRHGQVKTLGNSLKSDFTNGSLVKDVAIAGVTQVLSQMSKGKSIEDSVGTAARFIATPEYLVGNLMGGTLGAAIGSLIPVPILGGVMGQLIGQTPAMAGAMLGSSVGAKIVRGVREGNLDMGEVVRSIDLVNLGFQSVGATAGMLIGNALPVPVLGQIVGGVLGGQAGLSAARWVKARLHLKDRDHDYNDIPDVVLNDVSIPFIGPVKTTTTGSGTSAPAPSQTTTEIQRAKDEQYRRYLAAESAGRTQDAAEALRAYTALDRALALR